MKKLCKLLTLLLAVTALCFTATACFGGDGSNPTPTQTPTPSASTAPSAEPSVTPSVVPSVAPSVEPSVAPSVVPTNDMRSLFSVNATGETLMGLTGVGKRLSRIEIPESINNVQITTIDDNLFYDCGSLTEIVIPNSVTSIGEWAFSSCDSLMEIVIPDSVTSIGVSAFSGCDSLTTVTFGENSQLTSIGNYAFRGCTSLTEIVIPEGVTSIGDGVFYHCSCLTIYCEEESQPNGWSTIWNAVNDMGNRFFPVVWNCKNNDVADDGNIYTVQNGIRYALKDGVATVVEQPRNITGSITIPASVTYKGNTYAVTSIGEEAFYSCYSLTKIVIPNSVTSIGSWAFAYCDSLTIYCEAASKPSGWDSDWNKKDSYGNKLPVVWGYTGE